MSHHINLLRIKAIAGLLKQIKEEFVFVGGATVSLYGDENRGEARPTDDVDVVVELASYSGYAELDEKLRSVGFVNDMESGVICRYKIQGIIVDIMPTDASVIGFSNIWYVDGFKNAINIKIDDCNIKIFSLPYFIASKIEAFKGRGLNNYLFSSDFEDIVYVLENNSNVLNLIKEAPAEIVEYLKQAFSDLRNNPNFEEGLSAHLEPYTQLKQIEKIKKIFNDLIENK
jgi:predicted nucleotidyltransferase